MNISRVKSIYGLSKLIHNVTPQSYVCLTNLTRNFTSVNQQQSCNFQTSTPQLKDLKSEDLKDGLKKKVETLKDKTKQTVENLKGGVRQKTEDVSQSVKENVEIAKEKLKDAKEEVKKKIH